MLYFFANTFHKFKYRQDSFCT